MGEPLPPVDESHRVLLSALETLRSTRTAQMALVARRGRGGSGCGCVSVELGE